MPLLPAITTSWTTGSYELVQPDQQQTSNGGLKITK